MKNSIRLDDITYARLKKHMGKDNALGNALLEIAHGLPSNVPQHELIPAMTFFVVAWMRLHGASKEGVIKWVSECYESVDDGYEEALKSFMNTEDK